MRKGFGSDSMDEVRGAQGLQKMIAASKTIGTLNLSNRQLQEVCSKSVCMPAVTAGCSQRQMCCAVLY